MSRLVPVACDHKTTTFEKTPVIKPEMFVETLQSPKNVIFIRPSNLNSTASTAVFGSTDFVYSSSNSIQNVHDRFYNAGANRVNDTFRNISKLIG